MKKLLITLLLVSPLSFADWGDVYYCQMTSYAITGHDGELKEVELGKFQFKLDKTKNAVVIGKDSSLGGMKMELIQDDSRPVEERWFAGDSYTMLFFSNGKFLYSSNLFSYISSVSANCDKF